MRLKYCTSPVRKTDRQSQWTSHCYPMTPPTMLLRPNKLLKNSTSQPKSYAQPITSITTRRLRLPNDLHHLAPLQSQISRHRITDLNTRKLGILQTVSKQELLPLLLAKRDMLRDQFMMRDIDQEILLNETFHTVLGSHSRDDLQSRTRRRNRRDEDAILEVIGRQVLHKSAHLLDSHGDVCDFEEFNVDGTEIWVRVVWVVGIALDHPVAGVG